MIELVIEIILRVNKNPKLLDFIIVD